MDSTWPPMVATHTLFSAILGGVSIKLVKKDSVFSRACHQGELPTRLKGSKRDQKGPKGPKRGPKGPKGANSAPKKGPKGPKRAQRGKLCPKYCQYCTKTGQESQNFDIRRHNYARGWSLRQHIGIK